MNDNFVSQFNEANGKFLPYMISDHSPCELTLPKEMIKCKRAFRFSNFTAHKDEFIQIVKEEWKKEVKGCSMYKLVKKLKSTKQPLTKLSWQKGNVFERVEDCRGKLKKGSE